jgi:peptidoglycan/LPS O-acetylase OafA/YrhL
MVIANQDNGRIVALDFTKGALVLFMILYHWLNYFVSTTGMFYNYLRFITVSFIFISGFLVTNVALAKYHQNDRRLRWRLLERGVKLLVLFTLLNIASGLLLPGGRSDEVGMARDVGSFFQNAKAVYVTGNGKGAAFQILVPISYVLIVAGFLTFAGHWFRVLLLGCAGIGTILIAMLSMAGQPSGQLYCLGSGVLGLCIGTISLKSIERLLSFPIALIVAYCAYLTLVTILEVFYVLQVAGALLTLLIIYWLGKRWESDWRIYRLVVTLGRYCLCGYIAQIGLLHLIRVGLRRVDFGAGSLAVSFIASFVSTVFAVVVLDFVRSRDKLTDRMYRYVFA